MKSSTPVYDILAALWYTFAPRALQPRANSPLLSWQPNKTPFSTLPSLLLTIAFYLTAIFGGQALMTKFKIAPLKLQNTFLVHNFLLSVGSGLLLACMLEEIVPIWYQHGFFHAICANEAWTPRMETLYIFNYMFKVSESTRNQAKAKSVRSADDAIPRMSISHSSGSLETQCSWSSSGSH